MLKQLRLGLKFVVILACIFLGGILLSGLLLSSKAQQQAELQVAAKATMLMEMTRAVSQYTNEQIQPLLMERLDKEATFIPQSIPSYSARQTFDFLRQQPGYSNFTYKDAAPNPTREADRTNEFEDKLIQQFRQNLELPQLTGFLNIAGNKLFYVARPLLLKDPTCLRCHSTPEQAPKSQLALYGREHGFGWQLNQIVAAKIVYMPAEDVFRSYRQQLLWMMGAFGVVFAMVLVSIHRLIHRLVVKPIGPMVRLTQKISQATDPQGCEVLTSPQEAADLNRLTKVARQGDELGQLAGLFRQMASALAEREQSVQQMVRQIRYETAIATQRASGLSPTQSPANLINLLQQSRQSRLQVQIADPTRAALLAAPSTPDLKQLLRQVRSFQSFGDAELSDLLQLGHHEQWDGQQQICQEDEIGTAFYIVLTGSVEVLTRHSPPDTSPVLKQLQPGDFFGEVSLMLGIPRIASVQTLEPTTLFVINQTNFQQLLQTYPHLAEAIAQQLAANKAAFDQRQASLRRHGLIPTSTSGFAWRDWIRDRIRQTFKI